MALPAPPLPESATTGQVARLIGVTERAIAGRKADGRVPTHADGGLDLRTIVQAGIDALAQRQKAASDGGDLDLNAERARLAKEQADAQEMKNAVTRGELIPRPDVVASMQIAFANARARLLSLPSKAAPLVLGLDSPAAVRDTLTDLIHECCGELAATRAIPDAPERPADGGGGDGGDAGVGAAAEADGERVGRPASRAVGRGKRRAG